MRFVLLGLCVILLLSGILASPARGTSSPCSQQCDDFKPICAVPKTGKGAELSFGSTCVLDKYNCEHPAAPYTHKSEGECPGSKGIRLQ